MENNFYPGQRLVCVDDKNVPSEFPALKEGDFYTSAGMSARGRVMIKEFLSPGGQTYYGYYTHRFRPVQESFEDKTEEIAAGYNEVMEVPAVPVRELVENNN